jgi:hypothetical protein
VGDLEMLTRERQVRKGSKERRHFIAVRVKQVARAVKTWITLKAIGHPLLPLTFQVNSLQFGG